MRYKWAFHPEDYRLLENESFYAEKARRGWELQKRGGYLSRFVKSEPREMMYRLEIDSSEPAEDKLALYEECGWEMVLRRRKLNIFRAPAGSGAPELYTDRPSQVRAVKRLRCGYIVDLALSIVLLAVIGWLMLRGGGDGIAVSVLKRLIIAPELVVFYIAGFIYAFVSGAVAIICTGRLLRRIKRGEEPDHSPRVRRPWGKELLVLVWAVCAVVIVLQLCLLRNADMPEAPDGPYVTMAELGFEGERTGILGREPDAHVDHIWSPVGNIIEAKETVKAGGSWASLYQDVFDMRIGGLGDEVMEMLIREEDRYAQPSEYEEMDVPSWDRVLMCGQRCAARTGRRVVYIYLFAPDAGDVRRELIQALTLIEGRE